MEDIRTISFSCSEDPGFCLTLEDNGRSINEEQIQATQNHPDTQDSAISFSGIINIRRRIHICYGAGGLKVFVSRFGGFGVTLLLPKGGMLHDRIPDPDCG